MENGKERKKERGNKNKRSGHHLTTKGADTSTIQNNQHPTAWSSGITYPSRSAVSPEQIAPPPQDLKGDRGQLQHLLTKAKVPAQAGL